MPERILAESAAELSVESVVHVVEDDPDLRDALACLMDSTGLAYRVYQSPSSILEALPRTSCGCLVLDIRLPEMSGIELAKELRRRCVRMPIVMMSAHADVPVTIQSFKLGASDFLIKPFKSGQFLNVVQQALANDRERVLKETQRSSVQARLKRLTPKDWQVIEMLRLGYPNKRIAAQLAISERAVEMRRSNILKKTHTSGLPALIELIAVNMRHASR